MSSDLEFEKHLTTSLRLLGLFVYLVASILLE
jgi:hypothetical protein